MGRKKQKAQRTNYNEDFSRKENHLAIRVSEEGVKEYQKLFKEKYRREIRYEEAYEQFSDLLKLFNIVYRPMERRRT